MPQADLDADSILQGAAILQTLATRLEKMCGDTKESYVRVPKAALLDTIRVMKLAAAMIDNLCYIMEFFSMAVVPKKREQLSALIFKFISTRTTPNKK